MKKAMMMFCGICSFVLLLGCGSQTSPDSTIHDPKKAVQFNNEHVLRLPLSTLYVYEVTNLSKDKDLKMVNGKLVKTNGFGAKIKEDISFSDIPAGKTKFFAVEKADNGLSQKYQGESLDDILKQLKLDPEQYFFQSTPTEFEVKRASFK